MRDILNRLNGIMNEVALAPGEITRYEDRFKAFINHISLGKPFYLDKDFNNQPKGTKVILDPSEAQRFELLHKNGQFNGRISAKGKDGTMYPISVFSKTSDFGGATAKPDEEGDVTKLSKEAAGLKPNQIGITDQNIQAGDLGSVIINNQKLKSTPHGQAVIEAAKAIMAGQTPTIPQDILNNSPAVTAAIVDYCLLYTSPSPRD